MQAKQSTALAVYALLCITSSVLN